jgi:hypothetical protein
VVQTAGLLEELKPTTRDMIANGYQTSLDRLTEQVGDLSDVVLDCARPLRDAQVPTALALMRYTVGCAFPDDDESGPTIMKRVLALEPNARRATAR